MAKILLIDDDVDLVEMNSAVLVHRGHEVEAAYSASQARQVFREGPAIDLVVLDVMMEDWTTGFELAREIHEATPTLKVVILSGVHAATAVPFRFTPDETWLPVLKFLDKPVSPATLADEIEAILEK